MVRIMVRILFIFICLLICFSFAGVELFKKQSGNVVSYYFKSNNSDYRIIYLPKRYDNPRIMSVLKKNIFSDYPVNYSIVYDDYEGKYKVRINSDVILSFDKTWSYELGYSDVSGLIESYKKNLYNLKYLPDVFFEKNYIEVLTGETAVVRIFNKSKKDFNLNIPDYCYYKNGKLYISPVEPISSQTILLTYDNGQDSSYIVAKIPSFEIKTIGNTIYFKNWDLFNRIDFLKSFILPNVKLNIESDLRYYLERYRNTYNYILFTQNSVFPYKDIRKNVKLVFKKDDSVSELSFDYLVVSNNPEKISKDGMIFEGNVLENSGYWIWFHHLFSFNTNYFIEIENPGETDDDSKLTFSSTKKNVANVEFFFDYSKSISEVETGIKSSISFLQFLKEKGVAKINIFNGQKVRIINIKGFEKEVISGFLYIKSNRRLKLRIFASSSNLPNLENLSFLESDGTPRTTGKFYKPIITKQVEFNTSKNFFSFRIPDELISYQDKQNYSNYGVYYKIIFKINNDKKSSQKVNLYYSSVSGYTPFIFLMNNKIFRTDSGSYRKIYEVNLEPFESVEIPIGFLITPGFSYPIEFEISTNNL